MSHEMVHLTSMQTVLCACNPAPELSQAIILWKLNMSTSLTWLLGACAATSGSGWWGPSLKSRFPALGSQHLQMNELLVSTLQ